MFAAASMLVVFGECSVEIHISLGRLHLFVQSDSSGWLLSSLLCDLIGHCECRKLYFRSNILSVLLNYSKYMYLTILREMNLSKTYFV